jgi:hypothetical protein
MSTGLPQPVRWRYGLLFLPNRDVFTSSCSVVHSQAMQYHVPRMLEWMRGKPAGIPSSYMLNNILLHLQKHHRPVLRQHCVYDRRGLQRHITEAHRRLCLHQRH